MRELNIERAPSSPSLPVLMGTGTGENQCCAWRPQTTDSHPCLETLICTCHRLALIDPDTLRTGSHHGDLAKQTEGRRRQRLGSVRLTQNTLSYQPHRLLAGQTGVLSPYPSHYETFNSVGQGWPCWQLWGKQCYSHRKSAAFLGLFCVPPKNTKNG